MESADMNHVDSRDHLIALLMEHPRYEHDLEFCGKLADLMIGKKCGCLTCTPITLDNMRIVVCPICGNKRCPKATYHDNECTGSNKLNQPGSIYGGMT